MGIKRVTIEFDDDWQAPYNLIEPRHNNPCDNCLNNPKNNPNTSGFCNCVLPYLNNPVY